jgi:pimeloyl-ACP methyl ester carboxylesterase
MNAQYPIKLISTVPFSFSGEVNSRHIALATGVALKVTTFTPSKKSDFPPVILVPGLFSVMENFLHMMPALTRDFAVYFVETREKKSSICRKDSDFSIPAMAMDLSQVIRQLQLDKQKYILMGYSLGATIALESLYLQLRKPELTVLVGPSITLDFPAWSRVLAKFAAPIFALVKPVVKAYIRHFRVNKKEDPEMHEIQARALDGADPYKVCATIPAIHAFSVRDRLEAIYSPVLVIGASKDTFHSHDDALILSGAIPGCTHIDMETNQRNHSPEVVNELKSALLKLPV